MSKETLFGIIGGGVLGKALGTRLVETDAKVNYWDVNPRLRTTSSLDELVSTSQIILICTPSQTNRVIAHGIAQVITQGPGPVVVSLAKGIEPAFVTMDAVLHAALGDRFATGVISGPMLAAEISAGHTAGATVATTNPAATSTLALHLERAGLIVQTSTDPAGVARAGALKNVFALALGLTDGLKLGYNFKSALTVKALDDFQRVLEHFGSDPKLALGMAGLGDLLTTGWSGLSMNWGIGREWAEGNHTAKGEGMNTLRELVKIIPTQRYPVVHALEAILLHGGEPLLLTGVLSEKAVK